MPKQSDFTTAGTVDPNTDYVPIVRSTGGSFVNRKVVLSVLGKGAVGTEIPTTGAHALGEILTNSAPAPGQPAQWQCTTAGTPGTWAVLTTTGPEIVVSATLPPPSDTVPGTVTTPPPAPAPAPPAPLDPTTITQLEAWVDVSDATKVTQSGGTISQLTDKSHTHNAVQATGANQPAFVASGIGGAATARFTGSGALALSMPAGAAIDDMWAGGASIMAVINPKGGGSSNYGRLIDKGTWYVEFNQYGLFAIVVVWGTNIYYWSVQASSQFAYGTAAILEIDYNSDAAANVPVVRFNGIVHTLVYINQPPSGTMDTDASSPLLIGNSQAADKPFYGDVSEFYVFPSIPSDADKASLRSYLSTKWTIGVTAPTDPGTGGGTLATGGGAQPATIYDLASASVPGVTAITSKGYSCVADYTFGSSAGTLKTYTDVFTYFQTAYPYSNYSVNRLNDEWEYYQRVNGTTHVMATDHLKLRASIYSSTLFSAQVARCTADGDWGSWQGGAGGGGGYDCGVQSGMLAALRTQRYGYFEVKMQIPNSTKGGSWPAFWCIDSTLGGWPPEVDFLENVVNNAPDNSFNSFHNCAVAKDQFGNPINGTTKITSLLDTWGSYYGGFDQGIAPVIYGCEWQPSSDARGDHFTIYVNQVVVWDGYYPWVHVDTNLGTQTTVAGPLQLLVDLAFGGNWAGRGGACSDATVFPIDLLVYYVRMFAK